MWQLLTLVFHNQEELGTGRLDDLPMEDRPRNAPVAIRHGQRPAQNRPAVPMSASRNQWTGKSAYYTLFSTRL